jgi:hypothetical protein
MRIGRRWFMGLLPGAAAAQTKAYMENDGKIVCTPMETMRDDAEVSPNGMRRPKNGTCPVCATVVRCDLGPSLHDARQMREYSSMSAQTSVLDCPFCGVRFRVTTSVQFHGRGPNAR